MKRALYWRDPERDYAFVRVGTAWSRLDRKGYSIYLFDKLYTMYQGTLPSELEGEPK